MAALKARDIRFHLQGKVDMAVIQTLEAMAEELGHTQKIIAEATSVIAMMMETVEKFGMISENMRTKIEKLERTHDAVPDMDSLSTKGNA